MYLGQPEHAIISSVNNWIKMLKLFDIYACIVFIESYQSSFLSFLMPQSSMFLVTYF